MLQVIYLVYWFAQVDRFAVNRWFLQNLGLAVRPLNPQPVQF